MVGPSGVTRVAEGVTEGEHEDFWGSNVHFLEAFGKHASNGLRLTRAVRC